MSEPVRIGIIGCGRMKRLAPDEKPPRWGISTKHAEAYAPTGAQIVALTDIDTEASDVFREKYAPEAETFTDFREMVETMKPELVSVCTWPHLHAPMVLALAEMKVPVVHSEKPMAFTWGEAKRMAEACEASGTRLTINHQRRFGPNVTAAKKLLDDGAVGTLQRLEAHTDNLYDWGTHWINLMQFLVGDAPAEWVQAAVDDSDRRSVFGAPIDTKGIAHFGLAGGVHGVLFTGRSGDKSLFPPDLPPYRLVGTEGVIEIERPDGGGVRYRRDDTAGWQQAEFEPYDVWEAAFADVVRGVRDRHDSPLLAKYALQSTELVFATFHSARLHGAHVRLPLDADDNALQAMREAALSSAEA